MQLSDLIEALIIEARDLNPGWEPGDPMANNPEVLLAHQPSWPFEFSISKVVLHDPMKAWDEEYGPEPAHDDPDHEAWLADRQQEETKGKTIYIAEGGNQQYLAGGVATLLGWR
jgi:hypothetical protein